jgi:hypothetical protein
MPVQRISASAPATGLWTSPGSFLASAGAAYNSSSGVVMPLVSVEQLASRHLGIQFYYAGMGTGFAQTTPLGFPTIPAITTSGRVNVVGGNLMLLAGSSCP